MTKLDSRRGTYVLVLRVTARRTITVGRLGSMMVHPGTYLYVGSAFGPGGLHARVGRHVRRGKPPHWHIDHLRAVAHLRRVWFTHAQQRLECRWAAAIRSMRDVTLPLEGFGASDCRCPTHLFYFTQEPSAGALRRQLRKAVGRSPALYQECLNDETPA